METNSNKTISDSEDEKKNSEMDLEELKKKKQKANKKKMGISAEAYGQYNKLEEFTPIVIEKSES